MLRGELCSRENRWKWRKLLGIATHSLGEEYALGSQVVNCSSGFAAINWLRT